MPSKTDITDEQILNLYFTQKLNRRQTAEALKCSQDLIAYRLKKLNLSPKPMSECVSAGKRRSVPMSQELLERLDGERKVETSIDMELVGKFMKEAC